MFHYIEHLSVQLDTDLSLLLAMQKPKITEKGDAEAENYRKTLTPSKKVETALFQDC
jgi:hypothetical protein